MTPPSSARRYSALIVTVAPPGSISSPLQTAPSSSQSDVTGSVTSTAVLADVGLTLMCHLRSLPLTDREAFSTWPLLTSQLAGDLCFLLSRAGNIQLHAVGQHSAVLRADCTLVVTVCSDGQDDGHAGAGIRFNGDLPASVGLVGVALQAPCLCDLAPGHREGEVPQRYVAEFNLLAEPQLEGDGVLTIVALRRIVNAGRQWSRCGPPPLPLARWSMSRRCHRHR